MRRILQPAGYFVCVLSWCLPTYATAQSYAALRAPQVAAQTAQTSEAYEAQLRTKISRLASKFKVSIIYYKEGATFNPAAPNPPVRQVNPVEKELEVLLKDSPYKFEKVKSNFYIVVPHKPEADKQSNLPTFNAVTHSLPAPTKAVLATVTGKVTDKNGSALPGVTVLEKGTTNGTTTDTEGRYTLPVATETGILVFSFIGYTTQEVPYKGAGNYNVTLTEDAKSLEEVVVVGYGVQQRKDVTGSIASISAQKLKDQPLPSVDAAMAGQLPGVQVAQTTGVPGGGLTVRVRGAGSLSAGNEPLYVIDGFPVSGSYSQTTNPLNTINPNDIESIEVLKDASATAIYGSRGSNGVVIITTKSGKAGKAKIDLDVYTGVQEVAHKMDVLDARGFAEYIIDTRNNAWVDAGGKITDPNATRTNAIYRIPDALQNPAALGKGTDWQDEVFRRALMQNYQVSFSGGNERVKYFASGGYFKQDGVVINSDFERYSFRMNLESELTKRLKVGINLSPSYTFSNISDAEGHWSSGAVILSALLMAPHLPVYNPDGSYTTGLDLGNGFSSIENPVKTAKEKVNQYGRLRLLGTTFAQYNITDNLVFKATVGTDFRTSRQNTFVPSIVGRDGAPPPSIPTGTSASSQTINWLTEYTLAYNKTFGKHSLNGLLGYTVQKETGEGNNVSATNFPNDIVQTLNAGIINGGSSDRDQWTLLSYIGRLNYVFADRYLLTATVRRDGSSRFGSANKWGVFPSASLGWRASEEAFLKDYSWLSELKFRTSYGITGNNFIGNYDHVGLLAEQNYVFGGKVVNGLRPSRVANPDLGWETNHQFDAGVELSIYQNRLGFTVDYYDKRTSNLLLNVPVPTVTGYATAIQNIGKIRNSGWELAVNSRNFVNAFTWSTDFNIAFNKNKVLALGPEGAPIFGNYQLTSSHITQIGSPLGNYYGYLVEGIFQDEQDIANNPHFADSAPGQFKFKDVSGDGKLSVDDRVMLGNPFPDFTYGLTNNFSFKGFDLNILLQGVQGFEILHLGRRFYGNYAGTANSLADVTNRWRSADEPGDGKTPRVNRDLAKYSSSNASANISSQFVEDASFLRVRNISLGYNFSQNLVRRLASRSLRLYLSIQNAHTFTKYTGYNPEVSVTGASSLEPGVDYGGYPVPRTYTIGLNLGL